MSSATMTTLIVDDHPIFRVGLRRALEGSPLKVVAEAGTGREAISLASKFRPGIVLLDLGLPDQDGFEVCRALRASSPESIVVFLSSYDDIATVRACRSAGGHGHLAKDTPVPKLIEHSLWLGAHPDATLFPHEGSSPLTEREMDVLEGISMGLQQPEIARRLGIGVETVKTYVQSVYGKLGVNDRASALHVARTLNLIDAPPARGYRS